MIVQLKFRLPEERAEFDAAFYGLNYMSVLHDLQELFRSTLKYRQDLSKQQLETWEELRSKFYELLDEHDVTRLLG